MTLAELGSILRDKREALGFSVDDISERIKVSMRIIKLIEEGNEAGLPHSVYTRGFIISYAEVLQMDKEELLTQLDIIFPCDDIEEIHPTPQIISPNQRRGVRLKQLILLVMLLAIIGSVAFGGWFVVNNFGSDIVELVKKPFAASSDSPQNSAMSVAEEGAQPAGVTSARENATASVPSSGLTSSGQGSTDAVQANNQEGRAGTETAESTADSSIVLPQSPSHDTTTGQEKTTPAAQNTQENIVVISPRAPCWTRVIADKKQILEKTITPGNDFTFQYTHDASILLGNPSGVTLTINGEPYKGNLRSSQTLTINLPL